MKRREEEMTTSAWLGHVDELYYTLSCQQGYANWYQQSKELCLWVR